MRPREYQVDVRGEEGVGDGCRVSDFCTEIFMAHFCTCFPVCESSSDGGDIWRGEVNFSQVASNSFCLVGIRRGAPEFNIGIWFFSVVG